MFAVQSVYDKQRNNEKEILDLKDQISSLKDELKKKVKEKKQIQKELDDICINLIKEKKIIWVECNLNEWRDYLETNNDDPATYYIYYYDGAIEQQGYFQGVYTNLTAYELDHFNDYINDYFYYGYPLYNDRNHHYSEDTECQLAFGSGDAYIKTLNLEL